MEIYLITFSPTPKRMESIYECHKELLLEIEKYFTVHLIPYTQADSIPANAYKMAFIASGGVEHLVERCFSMMPYPITLLADGLSNSLAASMEIATWIRSKNMQAQIIHGSVKDMTLQILLHHKAFAAKRSLKGKRIGVIGYPSQWLIASHTDYLLVQQRWGVSYIDIQIEEVYELFNSITDDEIGVEASIFANDAQACREGTPEDLLKAMRVYKSIRKLCDKYQLNALTLSCFEMIEKLGTTGCLALSLLNNEGIPAGCEGDLQSIMTLLMMKELTGQAGFMCNLSNVDIHKNEIIAGHCSIPTKMTYAYIIRNHYETQCGISIQGLLHEGDITVVKCGGECLDEFFVSNGRIVENTNFENICRTQVRVKLDKPANYFLQNPIGNHHILLLGHHEREITEFMKQNNCKPRS